jgi:Predicted membrane protein (DUF2232)
MQRDVPIGLGAGLASAVLTLALLSGSGLGFLLALFTALPITLVTLGWGSRAGLSAAVSAVVILILAASSLNISDADTGVTPLRFGLQFGVSHALPAWGLAYLTIAGFGASSDGKGQLSLGALAAVSAVLGAANALSSTFTLGNSYSDAVANLERETTAAYRIMISVPEGQPLPINGGIDPQAFFHTVSRFALPMSALMATVFGLCGLWLAARIVRASGRLPRPWPDVAALRLPRWTLGMTGLASAVSLLPDIYGFVGQLLLAALLGAFLVQGFAVVHYLSRGNALRPMLLGCVYAVSAFPATVAIAWSLLIGLGLAEAFFNLRGRSNGQPKTPKPTNDFN